MAVQAIAPAVPAPLPVPPPLDDAAVEAALERFRTSGLQPGDVVPESEAHDPTAPGRKDGLIPAPPGDGKVGPFNAYGLIIGTGAVAALGIFASRTAKLGISGGTLATILAPAAIAGVVGARLYHVATQWEDYKDKPGDIPKIWEGGGAIFGGLGAGVLVGAAIARAKGIHVSPLLDAAALALPIAQAVGRFGNYANQELFGRPTDLPWGLQVDPEHRPAGMEDRNSFHPTFLYEAGWNVGLAGGLYGLSKVWKNRPPGALFALYLGGYGIGRFVVEGLRTDQSKEFGGLRTNQWTALGVTAASAGALALMIARRGH